MGLTLIEAAKQLPKGEDLRRAVIEIYASTTDVLRVLAFDDIQGNALRYNQEHTLPSVGFRGINGSWTPSTGVLNPVVEHLTIAGGEVDIDTFIVNTQGPAMRASQENMKIKGLSHAWGHKFIKGDATTTPEEIDGLQRRIVGNQLITAGATGGGAQLTLTKLDEAIDACVDPTHMLMAKAMRRRLTTAARTYTVGGFVTYGKDEFGRPLTMYNDLPILLADRNNDVYATLAFDEACSGGGTNTGTSIYIMSFMDGMIQGIQNGTMRVGDLGEVQDSPVFRTRLEWYAGMAIYHGKSVVRLYSIGNTAIAA